MPDGTTQGAGSPATVSQPYTIPAGMTPEDAQTRIAEIKADKELGRRYFEGLPNSREARELDALQRHAVGLGPEQKAERLEGMPGARPTPPQDERAYILPARAQAQLDDTDAARAQLGDARGIALTHGLTPGEFEIIAEQQAADLKRFAGLNEEQRAERLDADMHAIWRGGYDRHVENITRYLGEHPGLREKLVSLGMAHNKAALMVLGDLAAARYGNGRGDKSRR